MLCSHRNTCVHHVVLSNFMMKMLFLLLSLRTCKTKVHASDEEHTFAMKFPT